MRAVIVRIAVAVAVAGCTTSPVVDALFVDDDGGAPLVTGGGGGAGGGEAGAAGSGGDGQAGDQPDPASMDAGVGGDGVTRESGVGGSARPNTDAGPDTRVTPVDAADTGAPRQIRCGGNAMCDLASELCCAETNNYRCLKRTQAGSCPRYVERIYCDERTDCPAGQVCCLATVTGELRDDATCSAECIGGYRLCDPARPSGCEAPSICADNVPVETYVACRD